jgi:hypothetical protein
MAVMTPDMIFEAADCGVDLLRDAHKILIETVLQRRLAGFDLPSP